MNERYLFWKSDSIDIWNIYYGERIGLITIAKLLQMLYSLIFINLNLIEYPQISPTLPGQETLKEMVR